jgi:hypothetical protein
MYAWTGSFSEAATYGSVLFFAMPAVYYANTMAWDWYDWQRARPPAAPPIGQARASGER